MPCVAQPMKKTVDNDMTLLYICGWKAKGFFSPTAQSVL